MIPRLTTILIILVGVVTLTLFFSRPKLHRQEFKAYFKNGQGLQIGAKVMIAGVPVGVVRSVEIRPQQRDSPVEVVLEIQTTYPLTIPQDAVLRLGTASLLGDTIVEIDLSHATGPPAAAHAALRTEETPPADVTRLLDSIVELNKTIVRKTESLEDIKKLEGPKKGQESKRTPTEPAPTR